MGGAIGAAVAMATRASLGKLQTWVSATQEIVREVPGGGVMEDQLGDTYLQVEGSIITLGSVSDSGEVDGYIAWLERVNKKVDFRSIDGTLVGKTIGTAAAEVYFLGAVNISKLSVNVMELGYAYLANHLAGKVADGLIYLSHKGWQQVFRGWVRVQPKIYSRGFLWINKGWHNNGKAYWIEATGGRGYEDLFSGYTSHGAASDGIERLQNKIWDSQEY